MLALSCPDVLMSIYTFQTKESPFPSLHFCFLINNTRVINFDTYLKIFFNQSMNDPAKLKLFTDAIDEHMCCNLYVKREIKKTISYVDSVKSKRNGLWIYELKDFSQVNAWLKKCFDEEKSKIIDEYENSSKRKRKLNSASLGTSEPDIISENVDKSIMTIGSFIDNTNVDINNVTICKKDFEKEADADKSNDNVLSTDLPINEIKTTEKVKNKNNVNFTNSPKKKKEKPSLKFGSFMNLRDSFLVKNTPLDTKESLNKNVRFQPLIPKYDFKFDPSDKSLQKRYTVRCNKNLQTPKRLTYVKFHDQIKPPLFCIHPKVGNVFSHEKIDLITDYDYDSDAEWILEEGDDVEETETESSDESAEFDWLDKESTEHDYKVRNKPELITDAGFVKTTFINEFRNENLKLTPYRVDVFPDELVDVLKVEMGKEKRCDMLSKRFGLLYMIRNAVVVKKIKELGLMSKTEKEKCLEVNK